MTTIARSPKLMFVINSFEGGGAERVLCTIAREFAASNPGVDVHIATLDDVEDKYSVPDSIKRHRLDSKGAMLASLTNLRRVLKSERPDAVVAFLTRSNLVAALLGKTLGIPTLISERVNTTSHFSTRRAAGIYKFLIRLIYPLSRRIICVSGGVSEDLATNFGISRSKLVTAFNPLDIERIKLLGSQEPAIALPSNYLVSVGRLMPNKNHALTISALARSKTDFNLVILGEGQERSSLEAHARNLGLASRVQFAGHLANPYAVVANAQAYVSSSLAEGFPNALVEAMCLGRPILSTDCDSGPSEILDGRATLKVTSCTESPHGLLVPVLNEEALSDGIRKLSDQSLRADYGLRATKRAQDFSMEKAVEAYSNIIRSVADLEPQGVA